MLTITAHFSAGSWGASTQRRRNTRRLSSLRERLAQKHPDDPSIIDTIATTLGNIGVCQEDREHFAEAKVSYQSAVDFLQKLCTAHPDSAAAQNHFARARQNLGNVLTRLGKPEEALVPLSAAQEASERLAHEHPGVVEYQDDVARGFQYLAAALGRLGHVPDAEKAYSEAIRVREQTLQSHPTDSQNLARLFTLFNERGDFELARAIRLRPPSPLTEVRSN